MIININIILNINIIYIFNISNIIIQINNIINYYSLLCACFGSPFASQNPTLDLCFYLLHLLY